jgi:predicted porin
MNRKMLVVALSAACASPLALADVTIYGTLNNSLESVKATGAANSANDVKSTSRVSSNTSKIGFKGNEDLGNGLRPFGRLSKKSPSTMAAPAKAPGPVVTALWA